ncbi:MAG TPA: SagB family peptide dehydrogenase [Blastocatellia bacterium]|nr:SagB family peptide dehydrogenase [Blastocatellia bacterium]
MTENGNTQSAWRYHDLTKHSYWSIRRSPHYLDWDNKPSPFKIYPDIDPIPLSRAITQTGVPALRAIASTGIDAGGEAVPTLDQLASVLFYSAGVTREKTFPGGVIYFRAAACAGALYPNETYAVCGDIEGLSAGVYHFNPGDFSLRPLRRGDWRGNLARATGSHPRVASAPVILVYSAISWRSTWKYRDRAYRYHFWDNGTILANALALAAANGLPAEIVMGFVESEVNKLVAIDGEGELALSLLALGHTESASSSSTAIKESSELQLNVLPLSDSEVDYQSIREMHAASSLTDEDEARGWRDAKVDLLTPAASGSLVPLSPPPDQELPDLSIEEVIGRRASTRHFARKAISFADLSAILDHATRGISADFLPGGRAQLNDIYIIVNRVDGLRPGAYFYRRDEKALEPLKEGEFSERAAYLTLEQSLGGDASATLFFMADLKRLLAAYGNRGYRAVQTEAGIIGGKAYLAAYALKRGATGLTFYDDDVTDFFSPHAAGKSCIFVTALGVPGKRPIY